MERLRPAVLKRVLGERVAVNDAAEAAALLVVFQRILDGIAPGVSERNQANKIIALSSGVDHSERTPVPTTLKTPWGDPVPHNAQGRPPA